MTLLPCLDADKVRITSTFVEQKTAPHPGTVLSFSGMNRWVLAMMGFAVVLAGCAARRPVSRPVPVAPAPAKRVLVPEPEPKATQKQPAYLKKYIGTGVQDNGTTWPMELTVLSPAPGRCATVVYPKDENASIACTAEWYCDRSDTPGVFEATERLNSGQGRCLDNCRVYADLPAGIVRFECASFLGQATIKPLP